jgi:pimeloyl-ACP methyl ester carboxylesterase
MIPAPPIECVWQVNGLELAGLAWGEPHARPVLALHGWLDNAASFSLLAPLLEDCYVVALDLTGHGKSACRSADASYQIWDDLPEILGVLEALGWERFSLLGHSRGAIIASLLAASFPERVAHLVKLDAFMPQPVAERDFSSQLRNFIDQKRYWLARENRVYASIDAAVASRKKASLPAAAARLLVERNLRPCANGFTWTTDLRLRGASAVKLTAGQVQAVLEGLVMPTLLLLTDDDASRKAVIAAQAAQYCPGMELAFIAGGHHFHMEAAVGTVALQIAGFLQG